MDGFSREFQAQRSLSASSSRRQLGSSISTRSLNSISENEKEEVAESVLHPRWSISQSSFKKPPIAKSTVSSITSISATGLSRTAFMSSKEQLSILGSNFQLNNIVPEEEEDDDTSCGELRNGINSKNNSSVIMNRSFSNVRNRSQNENPKSPFKASSNENNDVKQEDHRSVNPQITVTSLSIKSLPKDPNEIWVERNLKIQGQKFVKTSKIGIVFCLGPDCHYIVQVAIQ
ncbi:hypothetical protein HK100_011831 [Physocladia obscura]|uniref:Uncharacterized protein n=1 Tax=Physocladia obscura TaxID=109957 RepID=A0AAD5T9E3_9FUNG|nr:hypothetical protein HK100_011831 [Physocladia obscura]